MNTKTRKIKNLPESILAHLRKQYPAGAYEISQPYTYRSEGETVYGCVVAKNGQLWSNPQLSLNEVKNLS